MTFLKNDIFAGVNLLSVEPDSLIKTNDVAIAQGDIAGVKAHLFDEDGDSSTLGISIDHSGPGRGALLGYPLVNQATTWRLDMDGTAAKNGGILSGDRWWFAWVLPPHNEDLLRVTIEIADPLLSSFFPCRLRLVSTSDVSVNRMDRSEELFIVRRSERSTRLIATLRGVTKGLPAILLFDIDAVSTTWDQIVSVIVRPARAGVPASDIARDGTNPVPVVVPTSSEHLRFQDMSADAFDVSLPLHGFATAWLDRNINGIMESMTGAPAGTNQDYTHTESALSNPTRDRFRAFTRKTFEHEPIPLIPLLSHCTGGIKNTGGYMVDPRASAGASRTTSEDNRKAFAHYFNTTSKAEWNHLCVMPDLPSGLSDITSDYIIRWAVLLGTSDAVDWGEVRVSARWAGETESGTVTPTVVANTSNVLAYAQGTLPAHVRDNSERVRFFVEKVAGSNYKPADYSLLAVALWVQE
jgi:hypothetical protein